jgi:hypothetical protein
MNSRRNERNRSMNGKIDSAENERQWCIVNERGFQFSGQALGVCGKRRKSEVSNQKSKYPPILRT